MDFRTEWWSKLLVVLMIGMAAYMNPWAIDDGNSFKSILVYIGYIVGNPLFAIAIATIPVFVICWIMKIMPDLDYSIWLAFGYSLFQFVRFLI